MFVFEILITLGVIYIQYTFFKACKNNISSFSDMFPDIYGASNPPYQVKKYRINPDSNLVIEDEELYEFENTFEAELIHLDNDEEIDPIFQKIVDSTNKYLKNNKGSAADFNIIKNISERIADGAEKSISTVIALPLYVGLMGTFLGVIIGLLSVKFGGINDGSINSFLGGVLISMVGSFCGLFFTTLNNSFNFKDAKYKNETKKNDYYTFIQAELLPVLSKDMAGSLTSLKANLDAFNSEFSSNISNFKGTISSITQNTIAQENFLKRLDSVGVNKLVKSNIEIIERLEKSSELFGSLYTYAQNLSNSVRSSYELYDKLTNILDRFSTFEEGIKQLSNNFKENDEVNRKLTVFLTDSLEHLNVRKNLVIDHVSRTDEEVEKYLKVEKEKVDILISKISEQIEHSFDDFGDKKNVFSKLNQLDSIKSLLEEIKTNLRKDNSPKSGSNGHSDNSKLLEEIAISISALNRKVPPSVFRPIKFFKHIFSNN